MNFLLDTHTFLWFINGDVQLSEKAKKGIENPDNTNYISIASFWEVAIKLGLKKIELGFPYQELKEQALKNNFVILPLAFDHTHQLTKLPSHHRDPFDRIIISQAIYEQFIVISKDPNFSLYNVQILW